MNNIDPKPSYALCPLPPPAPNVIYVHEQCGSEFYTDEKGDYWYRWWCDDHGKPDNCDGAVKRIYSVAEYERRTAPELRTIRIVE